MSCTKSHHVNQARNLYSIVGATTSFCNMHTAHHSQDPEQRIMLISVAGSLTVEDFLILNPAHLEGNRSCHQTLSRSSRGAQGRTRIRCQSIGRRVQLPVRTPSWHASPAHHGKPPGGASSLAGNPPVFAILTFRPATQIRCRTVRGRTGHLFSQPPSSFQHQSSYGVQKAEEKSQIIILKERQSILLDRVPRFNSKEPFLQLFSIKPKAGTRKGKILPGAGGGGGTWCGWH
jgi:hypothetical protein